MFTSGVRLEGDKSAQRIMIVTGESSGDLHGANLIKAVHASPRRYLFLRYRRPQNGRGRL